MVEFAERMSAVWQDGDVRDIDKEMMHLTLQIVGKTLFSANVEDDADAVGAAMTTVSKLFDFLLMPFSEWLAKLPLPHTRRFEHARDTLNSVIYGIINERRRSGEDTGDLLSMLLAARDEDDGASMTDEQVRNEALTLFLAGHETTANALTWTWYLLSLNPDKAEAMRDEIDRVVGDRTPTFEDVPNLKYTEAVVAESMRLLPHAWAVGRLCVEEHGFGGFTISPGSLVLVSPYVMGRDPRYWDEPNEFVPERWQKQSVKEAGQKNIYFPFGGGVRRCIGESFAWTEAILVLATLAREWKLTVVPEQRIGLMPLITLRPKYGMRMRIAHR
jgi:cytochrome P450